MTSVDQRFDQCLTSNPHLYLTACSYKVFQPFNVFDHLFDVFDQSFKERSFISNRQRRGEKARNVRRGEVEVRARDLWVARQAL